MTNIYVLGPFVMWLTAQLIKFIINLVRGRADLRYLISAGGMPSAHAAVVCSLATITLLDQGFASPLFGLSVVLAAIVMYDSFGVRRSSGEQALVLNRLVRDLRDAGTLRNSQDYQTLREIFGHQPLEVVVGALLGVVGGMLFEWHHITERFGFMGRTMTSMQMRGYGYGIAALVVISTAIWYWAGRRYGKTKSARKQINWLLYYSLLAAIVLGLLLFSAYQDIIVIRSAGVAIISWLIVIISLSLLDWQQLRHLQQARSHADHSARRDRWLRQAKRK